jgi:predicted nucleic acid-binding protein
MIAAALKMLKRQGAEFCFALQNIAEFWNVCTRPLEQNGYGLSIADADARVAYIERTMTFLPDNEEVYSIWRRLVVDHQVRGVQVHDARLVAIMETYGLTHILTLNQADFLRYANIEAVHPSQVRFSAR